MDLSDLDELERNYEKAVAALAKIEYKGFYPVYPAEITAFMDMLGQAPWLDYDYQPAEIPHILQAVETATLAQMRWVLTAVNRAERFSDGAWKHTLETRQLDSVLKRMRQIVTA
jgi:hypothetical protein